MNTTKVYRVSSSKYIKSTNGVGAMSSSENRWNVLGRAVNYCASSIALATLENIPHLKKVEFRPMNYSWAEYIVENKQIRNYSEIIQEYLDYRYSPGHYLPPQQEFELLTDRSWTQDFSEWVFSETDTLILEVDSVIVPEKNYIVLPEAFDKGHAQLIRSERFHWDKRVLEKMKLI